MTSQIHRALVRCAIVLYLILPTADVSADEPVKQVKKQGAVAETKANASQKKADARKKRLKAAIDNSFKRIKVFEQGNSKPLEMKSVLHWNNPLAGGLGKFRTVVYLRDGQPKSVCCVYGGAKRLTHEFGSLSRSTLVCEQDGNVAWKIEGPGIRFSPVPDADAPRGSRTVRLFQMKKLIRRFKAIETLSREGEPTREELRLLTTPLYRYEKESKQVVDGAVFCFAQVTDPEALVVLEAVRQKEGAIRWEYAFVRRTTYPVLGQLDGRQVWTTEDDGFKSFKFIRVEPPSTSE